MSKFIVVGDATVDQMYFVPRLPELGGEVSSSRSVIEPGGAGGTIAVGLARLGNYVDICTRIGSDPFAELSLKYIKALGVSLDCLQRDKSLQTSNVTLLVTPDAQRTMIASGGASRYLDAAFINRKVLGEADALVLSAYSLMGGKQREYAIKSLEIAKEERLTTFVDMGSGAVNALGKRMIHLVSGIDYLLTNEAELLTLTGESSISEAAQVLGERGIEHLIVKVGAMGSIIITPTLNELVEAFDIDDVVDTTGAGDYFAAAFAHGIMQGYDIHHAARLGNVAGALSTKVIGAQRYAIEIEELERIAASMLETA